MLFSQRMAGVRRSYIREILKVTARPEIISFAGGLPHPESFPVQAVAKATADVLAESGPDALQYSTTEGFAPLREWIAARYRERHGIEVSADEVLITTGSQQALDLIGKVFLDPGDGLVVERPGYIGAIQSFSVYGPDFRPVTLTEKGLDCVELERVLAGGGVKSLYLVPSFQNPSGITYDLETRKKVAGLAAEYGALLVEDNPYGELRFKGGAIPPIRKFTTGPAILLGTFSKIVAPGLRVGWLVAPTEMRDKLVTAKQAADLHTSSLTQRIIHRFLTDNDLEAHIESIRSRYGAQRDRMVAAIHERFPAGVSCTEPEGGMFLWVTLPEGISARKLFEAALARNVAFVPGRPFYLEEVDNTFRLNFSNASLPAIDEGMDRLAACIREHLS
jgi:2-aminoadipate transaminase